MLTQKKLVLQKLFGLGSSCLCMKYSPDNKVSNDAFLSYFVLYFSRYIAVNNFYVQVNFSIPIIHLILNLNKQITLSYSQDENTFCFMQIRPKMTKWQVCKARRILRSKNIDDFLRVLLDDVGRHYKNLK